MAKRNQAPVQHHHVVFRGFALIVLLFIIGIAFYSSVEGLSLVDAFYFSGSTLTTLGYGDIVPVTDLGKVFTVFYTLVGIGTIFYVLGKMFHLIFLRTLLDPVFHERHQLYYKRLMQRHHKKRHRRK